MPAGAAPPSPELSVVAATARPAPEVVARDAARRQGHKVEVPELRAAARKVFARPDGSFEAEFSSTPVHVRKGSGWQPIDTTLVRRSDGLVAPRSAADVVFSGGGREAAAVRYAAGADWLELTWPGSLAAPELSGSTATYREVFDGVDLRLTATETGFAKVFVVKTAAAAERLPSLTFGVRSNGLSAVTTPDGLVSVRNRSGSELLSGSRPLQWESGPQRRQSTGRTDLTGDSLTVVPDRSMFTNSASRYPILVDPSFNAPQQGWTKVFSGLPNNAYWNGGVDDGYAKAGLCDWDGCGSIRVARSWWQFDISALRGAQIKSAEFDAHVVNASACNQRMKVWGTNAVGPGTTWNAQPSGWVELSSPTPGCAPTLVGTGVKTRIEGLLAAGTNLATFAVTAYDERVKEQWKRFDYAKLVVGYNWVPNVPTAISANVANGPSLGCAAGADQAFSYAPTPTLRATVADRDNESVKAQFGYKALGAATSQFAETGFAASGKPFSATIPAGKFAHGSKIVWQVRGIDQTGAAGPWSGWCNLTVDALPPGVPTVRSTDYPEGQVGGYVGKTGAFEVASTDPDVIGFQWGMNFEVDAEKVEVTSPRFARVVNGRATILATPNRVGPNDFYVRAVDRALNVSASYGTGPQQKGYHFLAGSAVPPPTGHWPLDGAHLTTTAPDVSANRRHGAITGIASTGAAAAWTFGRVDDALKFTGTAAGYVTAAGSPPVDTAKTFTVTAWAKLDRVGGHPTVVSVDGKQSPGFQLQATPTGQWAFAMFSGDVAGGGSRHDRIVAPGPAKPGVWTHLAGTYDAGADELTLYVDGTPVVTGVHPNAWSATGSLTIGRSLWNGAPSDFWPGAIDDVRVYDRLVGAEEIRDLAGGPTVEEGFYPLEEGEGTVAADVSGEYRNGTLTGDAGWTVDESGGSAVRLDGAGDSVTTKEQAVRTDGSFTVSARVKLDAADGRYQTVVSQDGTNASGFALQYLPPATGRPAGAWAVSVAPADVANPAWVVAQSAATVRTEWVHLTAVRDLTRKQLRIYVDGVESATANLAAVSPVNGNLVIGRAKQAGQPAAYLQGAIDDVHVYTGVRTRSEIEADSRSHATSRPNPHDGQLSRYVSHDGKHYLSSGPVPRGARFEGSLGLPVPAGTPGTQMVYSCEYGGGQFTSISPTCEGNTRIGTIGLLYVDKPADVPTLPVYRCLVVKNGDHFNSHDPNCEGQKTEWLHGYALAYRHLISYERTYAPADRLVTTATPPVGYRSVGVQGIVAMTGEPGSRGLVACLDGTDQFLVRSADCGAGNTVVGWVGNTWDAPPAHVRESAQLYSCADAGGERFTSLDEFCTGDTVLGTLGYVITRL